MTYLQQSPNAEPLQVVPALLPHCPSLETLTVGGGLVLDEQDP